MNEFEIIKKYFLRNSEDQNLKIGIGDDCAVFNSEHKNIAVTTDTLVENVHFFSDVSPYALGHKALAVNLSDLAAMGATPNYFTLAITIPSFNHEFLDQFAKGLFSVAHKYNVKLIGGDTTRGPLSITITAFGTTEPGTEISRTGAKVNDDIYISGNVGGAALAVFLKYNQMHLNSHNLEQQAFQRLDYPTPRVELGQRLRGLATSMLDLSDGFSSDFMHIAKLSHVGAEINLDFIPFDLCLSEMDLYSRIRFAVSGGDDYELCFTASPASRNQIEEISSELKIPVSRIGIVTHESEMIQYKLHGYEYSLDKTGFSHF